MNMRRAPQCEADHPGTGSSVGVPINHDEGAGSAVFSIRIEGYPAGYFQVAESNFVQRQLLGWRLLLRVDIKPILD